MLQAAVAIADDAGLAGLTMRSLGQRLGVQAMSLYHYLHGKEDLLDGIIDIVFAEIDLPDVTGPWREQLRRRSESARAVLARHPWALALLETRTSPGPATLRHHDAVLGVLRNGGFTLEQTARAYAVLDAYVYGFALQEASLPFDGGDTAVEVSGAILAGVRPEDYPYLTEFATDQVARPDYDFGDQFDDGLDLILDGLGRLRDGEDA
ncbi:TetR/AcrR family transcriptional regulator C-terminal domain-containing protein [Raineyella sp. W15-4]|uniref:TetR/AcrR family transcriptional regulator C-terminal domain-containing protein n=1 Tax=Raineyella sp. W15-4 TaxID=3081651 RepID=UPI002952F406|nr:TetR/AcrR family transcriptional regulator C-terminal domain-containing protein [Raineyella sp. W15-4]WOQ16683.1 TetR/AcrR family transcriptional regulator C-terminal domain-containing protein [Raineyella sp. W15-4]